MIGEFLKDFQDHGGIVATILFVGGGFSVWRSVDWSVWRKELNAVSFKASQDLGQHELNHHLEETLKRVNLQRLQEMKTRLDQRIVELSEEDRRHEYQEKWEHEERRSA